MLNKTTRTLNPLPFQDLEPHRFEDLIRQLTYDFRNWRLLEPTGRQGADDGYDARGFEITSDTPEAGDDFDGDDKKEDESPLSTDRLWQIQCKREKAIASSKLDKYIDEMLPKGCDIPYGVIFASPCDFSKKTRDLFIAKMREKGVQEFCLWGKADLEDMLFQPKNDNLLYAYFGISLVIRRRSLKTKIRALLATKRKAINHLGAVNQKSFIPIFIRDSKAEGYPYVDNISEFRKRPKWKGYHFLGHTHNGIKVLLRRYVAYREFDEEHNLAKWDYSEEVNLAIINNDIWNEDDNYNDLFQRGHAFLDKMDEKNRSFYEIEAVIPYERIVEIDPFGDTIIECPHIFVETTNNDGFFDYGDEYLVPRNGYGVKIKMEEKHLKLRTKHFPKKFPALPKPKPLPKMGKKDS